MASSRPTSSCAGWPERPQGVDLDERFEDPLVDEAQVHPRAEVGQRAELATLRPRVEDGLDGTLADVLDGQQAEADGIALDGEVDVAVAHVRAQHLDAQAAALGDGAGDLLGVVAERGEDAGHVLDRVVGLEVGGLVGDEAVARGMRLVEAVALEGLEGLEDRVDDVRVDTALGRLAHELVLLGAQHRRLLLADGIAQGVRLGTA